eukprot:scaffold329556_cov48-Prasinocladus_malaysianus.AAC.1
MVVLGESQHDVHCCEKRPIMRRMWNRREVSRLTTVGTFYMYYTAGRQTEDETHIRTRRRPGANSR